MKSVIFCTVFLFSALVLSNAHNYPVKSGEAAHRGGDQAEIKFEYEAHNWGDISQGDTVSFVFKFRNTGNRPLVITNVDTPCGCTTKSWTKNPVFPGSMGEVTVNYNSAGRMGAFNKTITVSSNAKSAPSKLFVKGNVVKSHAQN